MKKFSAVEWQSFSLKKDVENILKKLRETQAIQLSIFGEIALVVFGVAFANIFIEVEAQRTFWIVILCISVIPIIVPLVQWIYKKAMKSKTGSDMMKPKDFVDSFDNEICYYVLMSESYYSMLVEAIAPESGVDDLDIKRFYFIEASYYLNKAIADLSPISNIADKVLTSDKNSIIEKRLISYARYNNVKNLLNIIYDYLDRHKSILDGLADGETIISTNDEYHNMLKDINDLIKA